MTQLSPSAQAVLDAYDNSPFDDDIGDRVAIAAALRAVAEQVVLPKYQYADWEMAHVIMQELQDIAEELENK